MDSPEISQVKAAIDALQTLVYWDEPGRFHPGHQVDAAIEAQAAIADLVQSEAIQKLKRKALAKRKAEFKQQEQ